MNEGQWLSGTDPTLMLDYLREPGGASNRKLRLFAVACCRRLLHLRWPDAVQESLEVAERFADGQATADDLHRAAADAARYDGAFPLGLRAGAVARACGPDARDAASATGQVVSALYVAAGRSQSVRRAEAAEHADLLRCLLGNPFRVSAPIGPAALSWNGCCVVKLAWAAYEERSWADGTLDKTRLAVLADALEEAGVDDNPLLEHLRGPGPHVRGCFVLDAILGKT
jgi:hypothetical protein